MVDDQTTMDLVNFLRGEESRATDISLDEQRASAIRAYNGDKYGDEIEGRSQAVTRDVAEVVDFLMAGVLGTVIAGGKAVEFETEPEDVAITGPDGQPQMTQPQDGSPPQPQTQRIDYGAEATAAIQYYFMRKQRGYFILHDALKTGFLEKSAIVKTYVEMRRPQHVKATLPGAAIEMGDNGPHINGQQVISADPADPAMATPDAPWNVTVAQPAPSRVCDEPIPNEWFMIAPDATNLDDAIYLGNRTPKTMGDLVAMGYHVGELSPIWDSAPPNTVVERARDADRSQTRLSIGQRTGANRQLWLCEEFPLYDLDGDGVAERLFVHRIGGHLLNVMPIEEQPYSGWSPFPMQGRFTGQSIADKTMDIQRIRSVLLRLGLDSAYQSVAPRTTLSEETITEDTIDDLLTVRPGGIIRYRGSLPPQPLQINDVSQTAFQAMEMMSAERESRTGITRQSQGLNPDTTNKTASGMAMLQTNADQIELYIIRNFVEGLVAPMFAKRYKLMRETSQPFRMKIGGKYQTVDPSKWPEEIDMAINVGLGTGDKAQRIAYRTQLGVAQQEMIAAGMPIVGPEEIFNNLSKFVQDADLGVPTDYVKDPSTIPPQPPRPDPAMAKVQGEQMLESAKQQQAAQSDAAKFQLEQHKAQQSAALQSQQQHYDLQAKREAAALDAQLKQQKADQEAAIAVRRQNLEANLAERRFAFEQEMANKKHAHEVSMANANIAADRPGGSLAS